MKRKTILLIFLAIICGLGLLLAVISRRGSVEEHGQGNLEESRPAAQRAGQAKQSNRSDAAKRTSKGIDDSIVAAVREASRQADGKPAGNQATPELNTDLRSAQTEAAAAEAIRKVEAWEAMIDRLEDVKEAPTVGQVMQLRGMFAMLGQADQMDAITTALHLLSDEQFPVLYGLLFDKTQKFEVLDEIFSDALNRPEEIKVPLMRLLMEDKEHPLSAEAERILDATGELDEELDDDD